MAALMWISHAERPLKADELCHALGVEIGSPNLNTDYNPSIDTLLACCQGLFVVGKEASTVQLIHFTLQEYLRAYPDLFRAAHSTIAETCLSYLNSEQVRALSTSLSSNLHDLSFLEYSSVYWGVHANRDLSACTRQLALTLFDGYEHHISTKTLLKTHGMHWYAVDFDKPSMFNGLHCASFFGIVEIVAYLVKMEGCDINQVDSMGNTPLHWAAWNGHEGVVRMLLRQDGISPDKPDNCGRIPLHYASGRGREGVVKILLGRGAVNPNKPDSRGQTPLYCAAWAGQAGVVKILLGHDDVNPDKPDVYGQTPLFGAASNGHERVVGVLLGRDDVDPDKPNKNGQTPLFAAAWDGHEGVVKSLITHDDVNPGKLDKSGRTPLWWAVKSGHAGVVALLQPLAPAASRAS